MNRRAVVRGLTVAYVLVLAYVALWPTPVDRPAAEFLNSALLHLHGWGAPSWVDYGFVEFGANVALFVPLGFMVDAWRRTHPVRILLLGIGASATIELLQAALSPQRFSTATDIAANSIGTALGIGLLGLAALGVRLRGGAARADTSRNRS